MSLPTDRDEDMLGPGSTMSRDEVILKIYEDLGATKTGIEYLVRRDEEASGWRDRMEEKVTAIEVDLAEAKAGFGGRVGELEKARDRQDDRIARALGAGAALLAGANFLPSGVRQAILSLFGQ